MSKTLPCLGAASVPTPNAPTAPGGSTPGGTDAAADGTTLKVVPPTTISPIGDTRLTNRILTMVAGNSLGKFANAAYSYEFQLLTDGGQLVGSTTRPGGDGMTVWTYPEELARDTAYTWHVRATLNGAVGPWSSQDRFLTVKENRTANPPAGSQGVR